MKRERGEEEPPTATNGSNGLKKPKAEDKDDTKPPISAAGKGEGLAALKAKLAADRAKLTAKLAEEKAKAPPVPATPAFNPVLSDILLQRKLEVEGRLKAREYGITTPSILTGTTTPLSASNLAAIETAKQQAMARGIITPLPSGTTSVLPPPLLLDERGREIDSSGNVISAKREIVATSLINRRIEQQQLKSKKIAKIAPVDITQSVYYDPNVVANERKKGRKLGFKFVQAGTYVREAEELRKEQQLKLYEEKAEQVKQQGGAKSELAEILVKALKEDEPPEVEWWDGLLLANEEELADELNKGKENADEKKIDEGGVASIASTKRKDRKNLTVMDIVKNKNYTKSKILYEKITNFIQHPPQIAAPVPVQEVAPKPLFLTKEEKRKIRRQKRKEKQDELREMQMMGLIKAPEDKVKLSNMMRVKGNEAVLDPTKIEADVRAKMAERLTKHLKHNEEKKLTPEQRKEKQLSKLRDNLNEGTTQVAVYRVDDLSATLVRRKIEWQASNGGLTGVVILDFIPSPDPSSSKKCNIVVVEGAPRAMKKFKKLMLRRMDWNVKQISGEEGNQESKSAMEIDEPSDGAPKKKNSCSLVWEGVVLRPAFKNFKFHKVTTPEEGRVVFAKKTVEQYWNMATEYRDIVQELIA